MGLSFPSPGDLPDSGIKPPSLSSPSLAGGFFTTSATWGEQPEIESQNIIWMGRSFRSSNLEENLAVLPRGQLASATDTSACHNRPLVRGGQATCSIPYSMWDSPSPQGNLSTGPRLRNPRQIQNSIQAGVSPEKLPLGSDSLGLRTSVVTCPVTQWLKQDLFPALPDPRVCAVYFLFFILLATPHSMWDFSSPIRNGTLASCIKESGVFTTGLPGKSGVCAF